MQHHTAQQLTEGPRASKWVYTGGNRRLGRYIECCYEAWLEVSNTPDEERDSSPVWERIGHDSSEEAYAHMRAVLLEKLDLDRFKLTDWAGCKAPTENGKCDTPTKRIASIRPMYFQEPLCDQHRTREIVEAMWKGPGDWSGSW